MQNCTQSVLNVQLQQLQQQQKQQLCLCDVVENLVFVAFGFLAAMQSFEAHLARHECVITKSGSKQP